MQAAQIQLIELSIYGVVYEHARCNPPNQRTPSPLRALKKVSGTLEASENPAKPDAGEFQTPFSTNLGQSNYSSVDVFPETPIAVAVAYSLACEMVSLISWILNRRLICNASPDNFTVGCPVCSETTSTS